MICVLSTLFFLLILIFSSFCFLFQEAQSRRKFFTLLVSPLILSFLNSSYLSYFFPFDLFCLLFSLSLCQFSPLSFFLFVLSLLFSYFSTFPLIFSPLFFLLSFLSFLFSFLLSCLLSLIFYLFSLLSLAIFQHYHGCESGNYICNRQVYDFTILQKTVPC